MDLCQTLSLKNRIELETGEKGLITAYQGLCWIDVMLKVIYSTYFSYMSDDFVVVSRTNLYSSFNKVHDIS